jgi:predicted NBD/HSP70 family sugar kinase
MMKYIPSLEPSFEPMILKLRDFLKKGTIPFAICVERNNGYRYRYDLKVLEDNDEENCVMVERVIKTILWVVGGYKIYLGGKDTIVEKMQEVFSVNGKRSFDAKFMANVYNKPFEVVAKTLEEVPASVEASLPAGGHLEGNRIGFDAGGSDRKVSAVVNGEVIYSEETVWSPKLESDPTYHYEGILDSFKKAAAKMNGKVDAIGVSSAGIYIDNEVRVASLFIKVPEKAFKEQVKDIYIRAAKEFNVPIVVANDGDVTALAGSMSLKSNEVLGIAMGTSEAAGYINSDGNLNGWLSELAFVPVDYNHDSCVDEWSGDYGCGVKYFSQDGIIKLAGFAGIKFDEKLSPAEKLKVVQKMMAEDSPVAKEIYENMGIYLGYSIAYYSLFYKINYLLLLGRVTSGKGGDIMIAKANEVLANEFPELSQVKITTPDEKMRRVGQSIAAASLPECK